MSERRTKLPQSLSVRRFLRGQVLCVAFILGRVFEGVPSDFPEPVSIRQHRPDDRRRLLHSKVEALLGQFLKNILNLHKVDWADDE